MPDWATISSLATAGATLLLVARHWNLDRLDPR